LPSTPAAAEPSPVPGGLGIQLLDAPVDSRADPRAQLYIVDHLAPGSVIQRRVKVSNTSSSTQRAEVYAGAAVIQNGSFAFAPDRTPNELTSWISFDEPLLELPAGAEQPVLATIRVPTDAETGERYGVIWAAIATGTTDGGTVQVHRVGVRIYLDIGLGAPSSDFVIDELAAVRDADGRPSIVLRVHNTGRRALDLTGTLTLDNGPGGLSAGPYRIANGTTLGPGDAAPITLPLDPRLPDGPWTVHLTLVSGLVERSLTAVVTFPRPGQSVRATRPGRPWYLYAILAGGLLAAAGSFAGRRIARRRTRADADKDA
jgi:hypothetical protein